MVFIWCVGEHEQCLNKCVKTLFICTCLGQIVEPNLMEFCVGFNYNFVELDENALSWHLVHSQLIQHAGPKFYKSIKNMPCNIRAWLKCSVRTWPEELVGQL